MSRAGGYRTGTCVASNLKKKRYTDGKSVHPCMSASCIFFCVNDSLHTGLGGPIARVVNRRQSSRVTKETAGNSLVFHDGRNSGCWCSLLPHGLCSLHLVLLRLQGRHAIKPSLEPQPSGRNKESTMKKLYSQHVFIHRPKAA